MSKRSYKRIPSKVKYSKETNFKEVLHFGPGRVEDIAPAPAIVFKRPEPGWGLGL